MFASVSASAEYVSFMTLWRDRNVSGWMSKMRPNNWYTRYSRKKIHGWIHERQDLRTHATRALVHDCNGRICENFEVSLCIYVGAILHGSACQILLVFVIVHSLEALAKGYGWFGSTISGLMEHFWTTSSWMNESFRLGEWITVVLSN